MVKYPARVDLANLPTRIHKLEVLSKELGLDIFVKRDDETGSDLSGNKVRKLEFLLAEAKSEGADVVLTCGGVQSNHCRATAIAARRLGMDTVLFLRGTAPDESHAGEEPDGNLFLDQLIGAETRFITAEQYQDRDSLLAEAAGQIQSQGRRAYVVPEGGSNALGAFGYVRLVEELIEQTEGREPAPAVATDLPWEHIVCATGSGGTLAGLWLGTKIFGLSTHVWGVNVANDGPYFQERVAAIASVFLDQYGLSVAGPAGASARDSRVSPDEIDLLDGYVGPGYAETYEAEVRFIRHLARTDGILLDPVYTGKGLYGLVQEAREGRFDRGPVLFIHTGGIFSLFGYRPELLGRRGSVADADRGGSNLV
jgi:D-cysteine desulfhydrase